MGEKEPLEEGQVVKGVGPQRLNVVVTQVQLLQADGVLVGFVVYTCVVSGGIRGGGLWRCEFICTTLYLLYSFVLIFCNFPLIGSAVCTYLYL